MDKEIKTIQLSDKKDFDNEVNEYLVKGWKILDNSYQIIKNGEIDVYSVVVIDEGKFEVEFYENVQKQYFCPLNEYGKKDGLYEEWDEEGEKTFKEVAIEDESLLYKNRIKDIYKDLISKTTNEVNGYWQKALKANSPSPVQTASACLIASSGWIIAWMPPQIM